MSDSGTRLFSVILFLMILLYIMSDTENTQEPSGTPQEEQVIAQAKQEEKTAKH